MNRLLLLLLLSTAACSFGRTMRASDAMERTSSPEEAPRERDQGAVSLERQAQSLAESGEYPRAVVTLERALSISPNDARLWLSLAEVRFAQGEYARAQTLASRAASLAGADKAVGEEARRLEARAKRR